MERILLKNARMVNEGQIREGDLLIEGEFIARIGVGITDERARVIDLEGHFLLPGLIDDQVHFREPAPFQCLSRGTA